MKRQKSNEETIRVIRESERGENLIGPFTSIEELMEVLNQDDVVSGEATQKS